MLYTKVLINLLEASLALNSPSKRPKVAALPKLPTIKLTQLMCIIDDPPRDNLLPPTLAREEPREDLTLPAPLRVAALPKQVVPIPSDAPHEVLPEEETLPPPVSI